MNPFQYTRASTVKQAIQLLHTEPSARPLGGGTNLIDLMREGVEAPSQLVDICRLPLTEIKELPDSGVRIGAGARNSDTANHPLIRQRYRLLSKALLSGASPQLRNMATAGGNLMQRTRCYYFMDSGFPACNKRQPGSGCAAIHGENRIHAIFGASDACLAVHPSDMCVALAVLDAVIQIEGLRGSRSIPIQDFHRLPGNTPQVDTNLAPDELIIAIDLPPSPFGDHIEYLKIRDRQSFAFALVSCAAALEMSDGIIHRARLAFGGVAHKPWRAFHAEESLRGQGPVKEAFVRAAELTVQGAAPQPGNAWKVQLMQKVAERALLSAGGVA